MRSRRVRYLLEGDCNAAPLTSTQRRSPSPLPSLLFDAPRHARAARQQICAVLVVGIFAGYKIDNALFGVDAAGFPVAPATPFGYDWGYWLAVSSLVLVGVAWLLYMFTACTGGDERKEEKKTDQGDEEAPPAAEDKGAKGKGEETVPPPMPAEVPSEGADTAPAA